MEPNTTAVLKELGLTDNEVAVYLALLHFGSSTTGPLTKIAGLHRSRVYEALNRLMKKGLASYAYHGNKKYFQPLAPELLAEYIEEKKQRIMALVPALKNLAQVQGELHEARTFEGYKGLKSIFDNNLFSLKRGDEILVFGATGGQDSSPKTWKAYFSNYNKKRIEKGIKFKIIFNSHLRNSPIAKEYLKSKGMEVRFISQKTPAGINIHDDKVAIIIWKENPYAFLITSKEVSDSFREYFKVMWEMAER